MAYAPLDFAPRENTFTKTLHTKTSPRQKHGVLRRMYASMIAWRQRQADLEIARFLGTHGGKMTDEAEREIERRFLRR